MPRLPGQLRGRLATQLPFGDVCTADLSTMHLARTNAASHVGLLYAPSDVVFLDIWLPGEVMELDGSSRKVLTMVDYMTGFAAGTFLGSEITSEIIAMKSFAAFFITFALPRLIVVDADRLLISVFKELFCLQGSANAFHGSYPNNLGEGAGNRWHCQNLSMPFIRVPQS